MLTKMPPKKEQKFTIQFVSGSNKNPVSKAGKGSTSTNANTTQGQILESTTVDSLFYASHGNFPKPV
jgi:hypothetical protein